MTPRPEDVALLRRLAMYRESEGRQFEAIRGDATVHYADAARLRALASRLEGEGRDGEPRGLARFRLWLEGARRTTPTDQWERGYLEALRHVSTELNLALLSAPASSPQPTTTTEEHEP